MQANGVAQAALFSCLMLAAAVWDIRKRIIPDTVCALIAFTGLMNFSPVNLLGAAPALLFFAAAFLCRDCVGGGDIKLVAAAGSVLGLHASTAALILCLPPFLIAWFIVAITAKRNHQNTAVSQRIAAPFAPFLAFGYIAVAWLNLGGLIS